MVVLYDEECVHIFAADLPGSIKMNTVLTEKRCGVNLDKTLARGGDHGLPGFNYDQWASDGRHEARRQKILANQEANLERAFAVRRMVKAALRLRSVRSTYSTVKVDSELLLGIITAAEKMAAAHGIEESNNEDDGACTVGC